MKPTSNRHANFLIVWSVVWAVILVGAAFMLKGNPARNWVESVIFSMAMASLIAMGLLSNRRERCEQSAGPQDGTK